MVAEVPLLPLEAEPAVVVAPLLPPVEAGEEPVVPAAALPDTDWPTQLVEAINKQDENGLNDKVRHTYYQLECRRRHFVQ